MNYWIDARLLRQADRHWLRWTLLLWLCVLGTLLWQRWAYIQWLVLSDTDDNMRLMQVRALLAGQGWYDLRQYRMDPPQGFDIHWSRLVDLPIAGLILLLRPLLGTPEAERIACGIAPLLPLALAMAATALATRRLVDRLAWPLALLVLTVACSNMMLMFMPMRIDHHGWQLAWLAVTAAGLCDPRQGRGGATVGLASAVSLTIGLEMLPWCVLAGAMQVLRWMQDRGEARRLAACGAALAGGCALGFALFASHANQALRCDALTPVWLAAFVAAGAILVVLALVNPRSGWLRLALGALTGAVLAGAFAHYFPQCLGRPEGVSDELARTWLDNVREAKPITRQPWRTGLPMAAPALFGIIGGIAALWQLRDGESRDRALGWAALMALTSGAATLVAWPIFADITGGLGLIQGQKMTLLPPPLVIAAVIALFWYRRKWAKQGYAAAGVAILLLAGFAATMLCRYLPVSLPGVRFLPWLELAALTLVWLVLLMVGGTNATLALWQEREGANREQALGWAAVTLLTTCAGAMLLWQLRVGSAAQLLAVPGAAWLLWTLLFWCFGHRSVKIRVAGMAVGLLAAAGMFIGQLLPLWPSAPASPVQRTANRSSGRCTSLPTLEPLDRLPPAVIFTHVDLGPRLITVTHHDAVAGPYHRNGAAILDVYNAFTGPPEQARAIMARHHATYLLTCPNIAESTIYRARNPDGFYGQLAKHQRFDWLQPIPLPEDSPLRLWRILPPAPATP